MSACSKSSAHTTTARMGYAYRRRRTASRSTNASWSLVCFGSTLSRPTRVQIRGVVNAQLGFGHFSENRAPLRDLARRPVYRTTREVLSSLL